MSPTDQGSGTKRKALLVAISCFVAGALVGVMVDHIILMRQHRLFPRHGLRFATSHVVRVLDRELTLSADQERRIGMIVDQHHKAIEAKWGAVQPQVRAEIDTADREITAMLTPEQRQKFAKVRAQWRRRAASLYSGR